jgi:hypothetical protein
VTGILYGLNDVLLGGGVARRRGGCSRDRHGQIVVPSA